METKINLTEQEKVVIEDQLNGKITAFSATAEQRAVLSKVTDDAEALIRELDAYDELDGDLIAWYYNKYKEQFITQ